MLAQISETKVSLELTGEEDMSRVLLLSSVEVCQHRIKVSKWDPEKGVSDEDWAQLKARNLRFHGIPAHMMNTETFTWLCKELSQFSSAERVQSSAEDQPSVTRMVVNDCNIFKVPAFKSLHDRAGNCAIRIEPEIEKKRNSRETNTGRKGRTWAAVVSGEANWHELGALNSTHQ